MLEYRMCLASRLRIRYGISQAELARAVGVSRQLIGQIEQEPERQTNGHEELLRRAFAVLICQRRTQLDSLEHDLAQAPWLFSISKEENTDGQ